MDGMDVTRTYSEDHPWTPTVGQPVAVVSRRHDGSSSILLTTIVRIGKRDVVCENGDRWPVKRLRADRIRDRSDSPWLLPPDLIPADSSELQDLRSSNRVRRARLKLTEAADNLANASRKRTVTQAHVDAVNEAWAEFTDANPAGPER